MVEEGRVKEGLTKKIDKLLKFKEEELEEKGKKPKFSLPNWIKTKIGKKKYKNHALVIYLRRNREVELKFVEIENDTVSVDGKYYDARVDCYYTYGKSRFPTLVLPEWSLRPLGTEDYQKALARGETVDAQDITIKAHERMEASKPKGIKMSPQAIVILVIVAIVAVYLISTGGK